MELLTQGEEAKQALVSHNRQSPTKDITMRKNLPKTFSVLKFRINLLNF